MPIVKMKMEDGKLFYRCLAIYYDEWGNPSLDAWDWTDWIEVKEEIEGGS